MYVPLVSYSVVPVSTQIKGCAGSDYPGLPVVNFAENQRTLDKVADKEVAIEAP